MTVATAEEAVDDTLALRLILRTGVRGVSSPELSVSSAPLGLGGGTVFLDVLGDDIVGMSGSTAGEGFSCDNSFRGRFETVGVLSQSANTICLASLMIYHRSTYCDN